MWTESRMGGRDKVERGRVESKEGIHESLSGREQKKSHFYFSGFNKIHRCLHCLQVLDFAPARIF